MAAQHEGMSDHDMLIRLDEKFDKLADDVGDLAQACKKIVVHDERIKGLEDDRKTTSTRIWGLFVIAVGSLFVAAFDIIKSKFGG